MFVLDVDPFEWIKMSVLSESSDSSPEPASIGQEQAGASGAGDRRDVEPSQETPVLEGAKNAMWPNRVKAALGEAQDFGKFREKRTFRFLHLFSGPDDRLATALIEEGKKANLVVTVDSIDIKKDPTVDLRKNEVMDRFEAQVSGATTMGFMQGSPVVASAELGGCRGMTCQDL